MGSAGLVGWIAPTVFVIVLTWAWLAEALRPGTILILVATGITLSATSSSLPYGGFYPSSLALLDAALVLVIFTRDIRIG